MGSTNKPHESGPKMRPSLDPETREKQMIAAAVDLVEKQLEEGTASSAVIVHYLKLGASTAKLEKEKLERENELLRAKVEALEASKRSEESYQKAIQAMGLYSGKLHKDEELY